MRAIVSGFLISLFLCLSAYSQLQDESQKVISVNNEKINNELLDLVKSGNDINEIKKMIEAGADVNFRDAKNKTCLDYLSDTLISKEKEEVLRKYLDIFDLLKNKGAETSSRIDAKKEYGNVSTFLPDKADELIIKYHKIILPPKGTDKKDVEAVYGKEHFINSSDPAGHYTPNAYRYRIDYPKSYNTFYLLVDESRKLDSNRKKTDLVLGFDELTILYDGEKVESAGIDFGGKLQGIKVCLTPATEEEIRKKKDKETAEKLGDLRVLMEIYFKNESALKKASWNRDISNLKPQP